VELPRPHRHPTGADLSPPLTWYGRALRPLARAADLLLDPSIVCSFDQTGFKRHQIQFDETDLEVDLTNRTCVVTGGNSGIGLATATALAERNATVWILGRNLARSEDAVARLQQQTGNPRIHSMRLDLTDTQSIEAVASNLPAQHIDVLVNNAGALFSERAETADGIERTLATNLLGPMRLTASLLPRLRAGTRSRIIWVSSGGMYTQQLNLADLETPPEPFDGVVAYAQVKRAMASFSTRLAAELTDQGINVHCMHPGWADTPGVETALPKFWRVTKKILRTPESGADTIVWLATCDKASTTTGQFWFDRKPRSQHLLPRTRPTQGQEDALWLRLHECAEIRPQLWQNT